MAASAARPPTYRRGLLQLNVGLLPGYESRARYAVTWQGARVHSEATGRSRWECPCERMGQPSDT